jgi:allene oxide cyclase
MKRNQLLTFGAAAVVVAAVSIVGWAATASTRAADQDLTLTVVEHAETDTIVDIGTDGDSRGDQLAFGNPVYDSADSRRVGQATGSCIRTTPGVEWECAWTLRLDDGSLMVQGPFFDARDSVLAITGGTGDYAGARGSMRLQALDSTGSKYRFTYRVRG